MTLDLHGEWLRASVAIRASKRAGPGDDEDDEVPIGDPPDDDEGDDWDDDDDDDEDPLQATAIAPQHRNRFAVAAQWRPRTRAAGNERRSPLPRRASLGPAGARPPMPDT